MKSKNLFVILLALILSVGAFSQAKAEDDYYSNELLRRLGVKKKSGMEGLKQQKHIGQFLGTISDMKMIRVGLEMYSTDHKMKYPASLKALVPNYLRRIPTGSSPSGDVQFVYKSKSNGKKYLLYCKGSKYSHLKIPANYPRCSEKDDKFGDSLIYIKPGVKNPSLDKPKKGDKYRKIWQREISRLPELMERRDPKMAKKTRTNLTKCIKSGALSAKEVKLAKDIIKTCREIEQGK